jgi:hypothetical protein
MTGSEFVSTYAGKGPAAWEAAALDIARQGGLTPWPWVDLVLSDGANHAVLKVQSDVLSIGPIGDHLRLPLTPKKAQDIFNLQGWLMPTPWLVYQIWRTAPIKLSPTPAAPNKGADLRQYADHSRIIDQQIGEAGGHLGQLIGGEKKHVIVSNIYQPGKVLIFGWYRPAPDVFDDGKAMTSPDRQPIQPKSNVHGDFYVDYSHGIQAIAPMAMVNGQPMATADLYQHPQLSKLVSNEGPVRVTRYPSTIKPPTPQDIIASQGVVFQHVQPSFSNEGLGEFQARKKV